MKKWLWLFLLTVTLIAFLAGWRWYHDRSPLAQGNLIQMHDSPAITPPSVNPQRLLADVEALSFPRFTPTDRQQARDYIVRELQSAGWATQLQEFEGGVNILAQAAGASPDAGTILLGAHYDTVERSPGADDNATAVAAALEAARLLRNTGAKRSLLLAFFDLEEVGLVGSKAFVKLLPPSESIKGAVVMDMIGYSCRQPGCQTYPPLPITPPTDKGEFLAAIADQGHSDLINSFAQLPGLPPVITLAVPTLGGLAPDLVRSDHTPFWQAGIGAVLVTDTANFRNPNYHQPSDTVESLDRDFLIGSAQLVMNAVSNLLQLE